MADRVQARPWWESDLEWNLPEHELAQLGQMIRNIPATLQAYHLGKPSPKVKQTDPVERMVGKKPTAPAVSVAKPVATNIKRTAPPAAMLQKPKLFDGACPADAERLEQLPATDTEEKPAEESSDLTLEKLLDPNFCGYL